MNQFDWNEPIRAKFELDKILILLGLKISRKVF